MTYHQLEMKTEKGKKTHTGPIMKWVTYTSSSLETGNCSLSRMNTYLHIPRLLLTLQHSHIIYIRHQSLQLKWYPSVVHQTRFSSGLKYQLPADMCKGRNRAWGTAGVAIAIRRLQTTPAWVSSSSFRLRYSLDHTLVCLFLSLCFVLSSSSSGALTAIDPTA